MSKKEIKETPSYTFDPVKDISAVEQFGFIDLVQANLTSSVPGSIESEDSQFNGIEDPAAVAGRPRDVFEQAQGSKVVAGYVPPSNDAPKEE